MHLLLAEINPDANFLFNFAGTIGLIATIIAAIRGAIGKNEAQKRLVSFDQEFARREDLERVEANVSRLETRLENALEGLRTEMKEDREAIMQAGEHRAVDIHTRLNQMQERLGEMIGRILK